MTGIRSDPAAGGSIRAPEWNAVTAFRRLGFRPRLVALVGALGIVAAACSSTGPATTKPEAATEAALLAFTQCMRDTGITNMPDPTVDAKGNVQIQRPPGDQHSDPALHERFEAARDACEESLKGVTQGFSHSDDTESQDKQLKLAQCLRSRGVDVPDPDFSEGSGHSSFGDSIDRSNPSVQEALRVCQLEVFGSEEPGH